MQQHKCSSLSVPGLAYCWRSQVITKSTITYIGNLYCAADSDCVHHIEFSFTSN